MLAGEKSGPQAGNTPHSVILGGRSCPSMEESLLSGPYGKEKRRQLCLVESDRLGGRTHHHPHLRLESPYQGDCRHPGAFQEVEPDFITLWGVVVSSMGGEFAEIQALVRDKTGETVGRRDGLRRELVGLPWWSNGLRFLAPSAGGLGLIPGQRTRFYMLQLRVCMVQGIWLAQPNKYILKKKKKKGKRQALVTKLKWRLSPYPL